MTGTCLEHWGDFGGLKHPTQLRTELAAMVALGVRCEIGIDTPRSGRLDPATFATVGELYEEIQELDEYLDGAAAVAEAAIVVDGAPLARFAPVGITGGRILDVHVQGLGGMAKLLTEAQVQFDVVDGAAEFERYQLVVLPDSLEIDSSLAARLNDYLATGGSVIAAHRAVRLAGSEERLWPTLLGDAFREPSPFEPVFARLTDEMLEGFDRYAEFDFALYGGADRWQLASGSDVEVYAWLSEPTQRRRRNSFHYPAAEQVTSYPTVIRKDGLAAFSFPVGSDYFEHGYWFYRELFGRVLRRVLPEPLVHTTAPKSAEVAVTHQVAANGHEAQWLVHVVNYSPLRRSQGAMEFLEDPIPLRDVEVTLAVDAPFVRAFEGRSGFQLDLQRVKSGWRTVVPEIVVAAVVVYEQG
jgi:hypothetical protein